MVSHLTNNWQLACSYYSYKSVSTFALCKTNQLTPTLVVLTPTEFEQLARDVFALVQRDRTEAKIDVAALTGKALSEAE